jgi:DNA-directed RNA polymerase subunit M/transcription elongation factor TFIIS
MAKGMKCPQKPCGYYMIAIEEKEEPKGTYVVYKCRACGFTLRVFEPK